MKAIKIAHFVIFTKFSFVLAVAEYFFSNVVFPIICLLLWDPYLVNIFNFS